MSWFSEYVGDPLKALLAKIVAGADTDLKTLAGQVAAQIPAAPISATAETAFETGLQTLTDDMLTSVVGKIPAVGETLAPEAVKLANEALDYGVALGAKTLNALSAAAKKQLAALAAPATSEEPTTIVSSSAAG